MGAGSARCGTGHDTKVLDAVSTGMPSGRHDGGISAEDEPNDDWDDDLEPGAIALPLRAVVPLDDGTFYVNLPPVFRSVLHQAVDDLRHRIVMGDDSTRRLFPTAYPDDPALDAEYRRLMGDELLRSRFGALDAVTESLDNEVLDADQANAWLQAMNALRLAFGTELGVDHDEWELAEDDPRLALYDLYTYLGHLVGSIIDALRHDDGTT